MRATQFLQATLKETPSDAEVISHQLMLRAGLIRRLASGLYTWLPLGMRVLRRVEAIIREEMDNAGALEVMMPVAQPAEIWEESGRWEQYGPELLRFVDRHQRDFCLGPTHEEVITDLIRGEINSYRQLPATFYQVQTKFRDEIRPRFGVMRSREFIMKDAYSFHTDQDSLQDTYDTMYAAYGRIFSRIGLDFRAVNADTGSIGGNASHEFHVLADSGEDDIAFSDNSDFAANIELAEAVVSKQPSATAIAKANTGDAITKVATPDRHRIADVCDQLNVTADQTVKTLIVEGDDENLIALCLRGDHTLNDIKVEKIAGVKTPLKFASEQRIQAVIGCSPGSIGPVGVDNDTAEKSVTVIADRSAANLNHFICGANEDGFHFTDVQWGRDLKHPTIADIRNVENGDPSPCGAGNLVIKRGIEVGHIFQLGTKYSEAMKATLLNESGKETTMTMGCYGIGVTRIVAAAIEQNHDEKGIIWPEAIAPFDVALVPINMHKSEAVAEACEALYEKMRCSGLDVLFLDEPKARLGGMLADTELMGIPHRVVVGDRGLAEGTVEYRYRRDTENQHISLDNVLDVLQKTH